MEMTIQNHTITFVPLNLSSLKQRKFDLRFFWESNRADGQAHDSAINTILFIESMAMGCFVNWRYFVLRRTFYEAETTSQVSDDFRQ